MITAITRGVAAALVVSGATIAVGYLFLGADLSFQWALVAWSGFVLVVSLAAALSAWRGHPGPIWVATGTLVALSLLAVESIGYVIAPLALLLALVAVAVSALALGARLRSR